MAGFSNKERMIAGMLSSMPGVKKFIKNIYVRLNAVIYRKSYKQKIFNPKLKIQVIDPPSNEQETFFGYYDKTCERNGYLLYHLTEGQPTANVPTSRCNINIVIRDISNGEESIVGKTNSYNWQQGARLQWIDDTKIIYNAYLKDKYCAVIHDLVTKTNKMIPFPVQDVLADGNYLSINYRRIMRLRPDYGYRNLPLPDNDEMNDLENDGIYLVDTISGSGKLLHSLLEITKIRFIELFDECFHVVNHLMGSPDGKGFIFIHRFYEGKRRHDRLMYSDFKSLKVLADEDMVSHCCWLDDSTILGYLRYNGENGFYKIDIKSGTVLKHTQMSALNLGDGHPSVSQKYVAFDTYPDKSRMQHLFLLDRETDEIVKLAELYHSTKYMEESRCDLHPRFSSDGKRLYFDTVFSGKRRLSFIELDN